MADISRSRTIAAEPEAIWELLADFGALSSWAPGADHSCLLNTSPDGEPIGTTRRVQVGKNALVERITEFDAPAALGYDIEGLPPRMGNVANRWTLRPNGSGTGATTLVTLTSTVNAGNGRPARMAEWVALRVMAKQSDSMLAGLANRMEKVRD